MKPQSICRHARGEARTTKRISGNTVAPEELWCSTSAWVEDGTDRSVSWDSSKAFSKPTAMQRMTKSVGREWYMPLVGPCKKTVFRSSAAKSPRSGCNHDCDSDGRTVCRRWRSSPQNADYCGTAYSASGEG